jgi:hypothetical protein
LTGKEKRVGGFDLIWDDGPVLADDGSMECSVNGTSTTANSFLGILLFLNLTLRSHFHFTLNFSHDIFNYKCLGFVRILSLWPDVQP